MPDKNETYHARPIRRNANEQVAATAIETTNIQEQFSEAGNNGKKPDTSMQAIDSDGNIAN